MKKKILYFIGIVFVFALGCLWHFFYPWSHQNFLVGLVAPVNESVPEHLKLLFFPFLIFSVFEYIKRGKKIRNFIFSKTLSVLFGMAVIVIVFYAYTAVLGTNLLPLDILTFLAGDMAAFYLSYRLT